MLRLNREKFEEIVARALDGLPEDIAAYLDNVAVVVEDEPSPSDLAELGLNPDEETLFGLYQGIALTEREQYGSVLPDRIVIYRLPLLEACQHRAELVAEIQETVVHEVGHHFGLADEDLP
jgi:predicted Zn-dependent protease with MMP-like domain